MFCKKTFKGSWGMWPSTTYRASLWRVCLYDTAGSLLCKSYSSITSLSLEKVAFDAPYDLISFITSFPRLLDLSLCHSHRRRCEPRLTSKKDDKDNSVDPPLTDLPIPLNLHHLTVVLTEGSKHFARYLCDMHHALSLTSLDIILNESRDNVSEILIPMVKDIVTRLCQSDNSKFKPDNICGVYIFLSWTWISGSCC